MSSGYQLNSSVLPAIFNDDVFSQNPPSFLIRMFTLVYTKVVIDRKYVCEDFGTTIWITTKDSFKPKTHGAKFVITESLFSMNGTIPNLKEIGRICSDNNAF